MTLAAVFAWQELKLRHELAKPYIQRPFQPVQVKPHIESWHGTVYGYWTRKCRCADCRRASALYMAERRADARLTRLAGRKARLHNPVRRESPAVSTQQGA